MSHPLPAWALALLSGAALPAQQSPPTTAPASPQAPAQPAASEGKAAYDALLKEFGKAQSAAIAANTAAAKAAAEAKQPVPALDLAPLAAEWAPRFQAGADKYKGQPDSLPFLIWLVARKPSRDAALATLLADHVAAPEIARVVPMLGRQKDVPDARKREVFAQILDHNAHGDVQAQVHLALANL